MVGRQQCFLSPNAQFSGSIKVEKMLWTSLTLIFGTLVLSFQLCAALPQGGSCSCNGRISDKGNGECKTRHQGLAYCYVPNGVCTDQQESSQAGWFWSFQACKEGERTSSSECITTGGDDTGASCVFPFIFEKKVYNGCTLDGADDEKTWCSTKVDSQGVHVSGEGKWGHCGQGCSQDGGSHIGSSTPQSECTCEDHTETDDQGRETGNCLTQYRGSSWCYIDSTSKCGDKKKSSKYPSLFWSQIACQTNPESESVTTEERIRRNEERMRRKGNTTIINRSGSSSCTEFVTSPGFPGRYPSNFGPQETQIRVPDGNSIEITFQRFDIESCYWCSSRKCRWDWVEFKDGHGKLVGERLCGYDLPAAFTIPTSTASVLFRSDYSVETTGYKICYKSKPTGVKMECKFDDKELLPRGRSPHDVSGDYIWSNGRIPFVFTRTVESADKELFLRAIKKIESKTCFKFTKHNSPPTSDKYLEITVDTIDSCAINTPHGNYQQFVAGVTNKHLQSDNKIQLRSYYKLADKDICRTNPDFVEFIEGGILHEFFHVLGVGHTQKRKDRDTYIRVELNNIVDEEQYEICEGCKTYPQIPYECRSIMHYGSQQARKNDATGPTMTSIHHSCLINPSRSTVPTPNDWKHLNIIADQVCGSQHIGSVLWIPEQSSSLTLSLPGLSREDSNCEITNPGVVGYRSQFQMIQGKLYACNHLECKRYNDEAKRWDSQAGMKIQNEREFAASTIIGDKWIVQGGKVYLNGNGINVPTTEEWTPGQPNWKVSTNNKYISTYPVSDHCLLTLQSDGDNKVMQIGGWSYADKVRTNRCFIDGREVASMKRGRSWAGCSVFQGKVYVTGGYVAGREHNSVEIYDPQRDQWTDGPTLPFTGRDDYPQLVEIKKELHYIGGHSSGKIWRLGNNRWEEVAQVKKSYKYFAAVVDKHCE